MSATPHPWFRSTLGEACGDLHDLAELYHDASKLQPALVAHQGSGISRLASSPALREASHHPVRSNRQLPVVRLPPARPPEISFWSALQRRRSDPPRARGRLALADLATTLAAGYGAPRRDRRTVPSGGALYPLELYVAAACVDELDEGVFHFDPLRHVLEVLDRGPVGARLASATPLPELVADAAAVVVCTAVFWRTRFKYGLRGYRFALLEAGHAVQNMLLAATALEITALPFGGTYDERLEELLGVDGVDESVVYAVVLGGAR
ncbi:MAG TPA: SagB/ThcOx family dehydrogenase [Gaiellaceae bacterium]|nr:SagB/ThcOx family dehydrogenase [Gaiellaceae bacterium]